MNILYNFNTTDASHPSFFEMFIQTQMMPSLKPALKYVLAVRLDPRWTELCPGFISIPTLLTRISFCLH
jgi:hypothetical protein